MHRYTRRASCLAFVLAGVVFCCLPVASAPAKGTSPLGHREVKVTVRNETNRKIKVEVYEREQFVFSAEYHHRETRELGPGQNFAVASGAYNDKTLVIATTYCQYRAEGMQFSNPLVDYPKVEAVTRRNGTNHWNPYVQAGIHTFHETMRRDFWDGAIRVTRDYDTENHKEFTENILREGCK